jgi:hypothetical protein
MHLLAVVIVVINHQARLARSPVFVKLIHQIITIRLNTHNVSRKNSGLLYCVLSS